MKVWLDGDACPKMVKEIVFRASLKRKVEVLLVANANMSIPKNPLISIKVVGSDFNEADQYIIENSLFHDLVITADVPMAAELVEKNVTVMTPRGKIFNKDNIADALSNRNLMEELRGAGLASGGPAPLGLKDKEKFANSFDRELTRLLRA
ncbi:MAG: YaiI/YqxD family protein [Bdellovibrionota bacterium]